MRHTPFKYLKRYSTENAQLVADLSASIAEGSRYIAKA